MDDRSQAELDILIAADRWAREVMRTDRLLDPVEESLLNAIIQYQRLTRVIDIPAEFPKAPAVPNDLFIDDDRTLRYSEIPTVRSPAHGIRQVKGLEDIILDEELFEALHHPFDVEEDPDE